MAFASRQGLRLQSIYAIGQFSEFAALAGATMPSTSSLWDIVKRDVWEKHDARHIADIWNEVSLLSAV